MHLAKYYWMKKYLWYRKKKLNLSKPVPKVPQELILNPERIILRCERNSMEQNPCF
jgi:hypothetical protein